MVSDVQAAKLSEIVVLATPTQTTKLVLKRISPHIPRTALLIEISSVKEPLRTTIETMAKQGAAILSIHPMFGPGAKSLVGKTIIIAQEPRKNPAAKQVLTTFKKRGAKIVRSNLQAHDRIVSATLTLPHFLNFAFIETLKETGLAPNRLREVGGTTFKLQLLLAEALYHENLQNEASILTDNKYSSELLKKFMDEADKLRIESSGTTHKELIRTLKDGADYVRRDTLFHSAYDRFITAAEASITG
jgi:prephenate dehydrogenase